ncbi:hypothetical protein [Bradyrhizobium elkanii]|uniref:hypothetical protein n=1 Tax=Bradyrhizobium elkanii TaxID=29448 RepID=UPI0008414F5A|nr:hypothetical protein [Bradyrhizobium elkanii]ODM71731.1 hypothetical protein A6X20_07255 [Bradyrhizobium elkanii]ODM79104.1 hypothetical protein A6452_28840 [Bradyrhizobium elkanii]
MHKPISLFKFIDGPLMDQETRRADVVKRMAKVLIEQDAFRCESDAIRVLMHADFPSFDVMALVGHAQQEAGEQLIAVEMSRS